MSFSIKKKPIFQNVFVVFLSQYCTILELFDQTNHCQIEMKIAWSLYK